ncbi:hypothetical protein [Nocardia sp. alder85J]|uniref:hypothetical protein n=1 Tax=Nocardia sp. alder85J TaxID=2862949 RepID=UPI001CD60A04|nr:hypothetical protein [Nocardia sp. alder85J]MCX4097307.1 hypothetical protein [Nocardia sp. alder85J]
MGTASPGIRDLVVALFDGDEVDGAVVQRIRVGDIGPWAEAVDRSGLFGREVAAQLRQQWTEEPRALLDVLLGTAGDLTRRRWFGEWETRSVSERLIS